MPDLLSTSQSLAVTDANGLASILPSVGSFTGTLEVQIMISAGTSAALQDILQRFP
jgi:hypothetical protein